jgi:hypothetical protein
MVPFENHPLDVDITIIGGFGVKVIVRNQGTDDVFHVDWQSHLTGGLLFVPRTRDASGSIQYLGSGEEILLQTIKPLLGAGLIVLSVTIGKTSESQRGLLLLFLFLPLET